MRIPVNVFRLADVCKDDSSRYQLDCIRILRRNGQCRAEATDGRRLVVVEWDEPEEPDPSYYAWHEAEDEDNEDYAVLLYQRTARMVLAVANHLNGVVPVRLDERSEDGTVRLLVDGHAGRIRIDAATPYREQSKWPDFSAIKTPADPPGPLDSPPDPLDLDSPSCCRHQYFDPSLWGDTARLVSSLVPTDTVVLSYGIADRPVAMSVAMSAGGKKEDGKTEGGEGGLRVFALEMPRAGSKEGEISQQPNEPAWMPGEFRREGEKEKQEA